MLRFPITATYLVGLMKFFMKMLSSVIMVKNIATRQFSQARIYMDESPQESYSETKEQPSTNRQIGRSSHPSFGY